MGISFRLGTYLAPVLVGGAAILAACGSDGGGGTPGGNGGDVDAGVVDNDGGVSFGGGGNKTIASITIDPPTASIESLNGSQPTQVFKAIATYSDGTTGALTGNVTWGTTNYQVGTIDGGGTYKASGSAGGVVTISAQSKALKATAQLTVKLHLAENPGNVPGNVQGQLKGANTKDPNVVWAYPYDGTVWPRGLGAPTLMWNGGAASDFYYVHVTSPTFELESFATAANAPTSRYAVSDTNWQKLVDSSSGATALKVARWDGQAATVIASHGWTIAPASMRGTIYYWANALGRVMRIKPGASAPDDFANAPPLNDTSQYPKQSTCLMTCHTVSADGSTIISGGGTFGGSYDLKTGKPKVSLGGVWGWQNESDGQNIQWGNSALTPDGKYVLVNAMSVGLSNASSAPANPPAFAGLYDTTTGGRITTSGVDGQFLTTPAFSPEGSKLVFVDAGNPSTWSAGWNVPNPGDLKVMDFKAGANPMATNVKTIVATGADPNKRINWPSVSPDGKWVIYQRGAGADTRVGNSDLYLASTVNPNQEIRLAKLDGDGYPFAAGTRDLSWNYEPTFAPVPAGGYFWVVFTSRRTYGNLLTGDRTVVKQLWVAAIDQNPQAGQDPSHPPFRLPGQDDKSINMRGFWALDPCKGDGQGCSSGTECCGGFCDGSGDGGAPVCKSGASCASNGDKCNVDSDCCNVAIGVTCIAHVCAEPPPK